MIRAESVKPLKNFLILIKFTNGEIKVYNCYPLLNYNLFKNLKNEQFFNTVHLDDMGLVCWDDATDIEPNELYNNSESVENFTANAFV